MIYKELETFVNTHPIDKLTSEDFLKLMEKPYLLDEIAEAYNVTNQYIKKIRKELDIENSHLETLKRDTIIILYYIYKKFPDVEDSIIDKFIRLVTYSRASQLPKSDYYLNKLNAINWLDIDICKEIEEKGIDIHYRTNRLEEFFPLIDNLIYEDFNQRLKNPFYDKECYMNLVNKQKNGKQFNKNDLTYDILYELSVVERIPDQSVGDIFGISKEEVRRIREKNDLANSFIKRLVDFPELYKRAFIKKCIKLPKDEEIMKALNNEILELIKKKHWSIETYHRYLRQKKLKDLNLDKEEYSVTIKNFSHKKKEKSTKRKNNGKKVNQLKSSKSKIDAGKLGEKIVFEYEIKELQKIGLSNLANNVEWITQTEDDNITLDGLGYDIISYNKKKEKIYIEVKTSTTNHTNKIDFNISQKEVDLMNGKLEGINKENAFIYYVSNIDKKSLEAQITIIDYKIFSEFNLIPTNYKISETISDN